MIHLIAASLMCVLPPPAVHMPPKAGVTACSCSVPTLAPVLPVAPPVIVPRPAPIVPVKPVPVRPVYVAPMATYRYPAPTYYAPAACANGRCVPATPQYYRAR